MSAEYTIYKKDEILFSGTAEECAKYFNVKKDTVYFWATRANKKRADEGRITNGKKRKKECSGVKVAIRVN